VSSVNGDAGAAAALRGRADRPDYRLVLAALDIPALVCADVGRLSLERQLSVGFCRRVRVYSSRTSSTRVVGAASPILSR
jgi:hypothetical protein